MHRNAWLRILEFVVAGVLLDLLETATVFRVTAGRSLVLKEIGLAILVIIPFAIITEIIIDHPRFWHRLLHLKGHKYDHLDLR
jgi:hypothetical protein